MQSIPKLNRSPSLDFFKDCAFCTDCPTRKLDSCKSPQIDPSISALVNSRIRSPPLELPLMHPPVRKIASLEAQTSLEQLQMQKQIQSLRPIRANMQALLLRKGEIQTAIREIELVINNQVQDNSQAHKESVVYMQNFTKDRQVLLGQIQDAETLLAQHHDANHKLLKELNQVQERHNRMPQQCMQRQSIHNQLIAQFNFLLTNYERLCQQVAQMKKVLNKKNYETQRTKQQLHKLSNSVGLLDQQNIKMHQQILVTQKNNKNIFGELKEVMKFKEKATCKLNEKVQELIALQNHGQGLKNSALAYHNELAPQLLKEKIVQLRSQNNALQKQLNFSVRKDAHQQEQINQLIQKIEFLTCNINTFTQQNHHQRQGLKRSCQQIMRTDLAVRKQLDRMQESGRFKGVCVQMGRLRTRRNRLVEKANSILN